MKKRNVKLLITATLLILCLAFSAVLFAACNGDDLTSAYAEAQKNWSAAKNKVVYDTLVIDGELGSGDSAVPVTVTVEGYRAYIGDEWVFDYNLKATGLEAVAGVLVGSVLEGTGADITLARSSDGNISLKLGIPYLIDEAIDTSFNESVVRDYLAVFDFADNTFYDAENISGSASAFTIDAESSLGYILYQIAPALSLNFNFDVLPMLESWLTLGDVTGSVSFADGNFSAMTTSQSVELFLPDEDADFLAYNIDNFPDILISFFETKKISIAGFVEIDLSSAWAEGISLSATVGSSAEYHLLASDATFDSVQADYDAAHSEN